MSALQNADEEFVFSLPKWLILSKEKLQSQNHHTNHVMDISVSVVILVKIKKFEIAPFIIRPTIFGITFTSTSIDMVNYARLTPS